MKNKVFLIILLICILSSSHAFTQDETIKELSEAMKIEKAESDTLGPWDVKFISSLNAAQASFRDWAAGGQNSIAMAGLVDFQALYVKDKISWRNGLNLAYGQTKIQDFPWRKTDDNIEAYTNVGYELIKDQLNLTYISTFKTQFDNGFNFPNDSVAISKFMSPGYTTANLGLAYSPQKDLQLIVAPLAGKFTFVNDATLSAAGAFGVEPGRTFRSEFGAYVRLLYNLDIMENINLKTRFEFFSNYLNNPQNIDVIGAIILNMKVNKWFSANITLNMLYDDDIKVNYDSTGDGVTDALGPRLQYKQVISVGLGYTFYNKKASEK